MTEAAIDDGIKRKRIRVSLNNTKFNYAHSVIDANESEARDVASG